MSALQSQYPDFFSVSTKCRIPNLNADNLREALYKSKVILVTLAD